MSWSLIFFISLAILSFSIIKLKRKKKYQLMKQTLSKISFTKSGNLNFVGQDGNIITKIDVEIASDYSSRERGLMFREKLEINQGILFIFPEPDIQTFWMKDTSFPLDVIFVNSIRQIIKIEKNTQNRQY